MFHLESGGSDSSDESENADGLLGGAGDIDRDGVIAIASGGVVAIASRGGVVAIVTRVGVGGRGSVVTAVVTTAVVIAAVVATAVVATADVAIAVVITAVVAIAVVITAVVVTTVIDGDGRLLGRLVDRLVDHVGVFAGVAIALLLGVDNLVAAIVLGGLGLVDGLSLA